MRIMFFEMRRDPCFGDCRKTNTKVIAPTNQNRSKQHDERTEFPAITRNLLCAGESRVQGAIGFGFLIGLKTGARFLSLS